MKRTFHMSNRVDIPEIGKPTAGGLDEAIAEAPPGFTNVRFGWSGKLVDDDTEKLEDTIQIIQRGQTTYIIYDLREVDHEGFYNGVANSLNWPGMHFREDITRAGFERKYIHNGVERDIHDDIKTYFAVNEEIAKMANKYIKEGDNVIVHDNHLIPVGKHLSSKTAVGYFHHTPMLNADFLETLERDQQRFFHTLLDDLYHYDLVALQTKDDVRALHTVLKTNKNIKDQDYFETQAFRREADSNGRQTQFGAFPVAGNAGKYTALAKKWENNAAVLEYMRKYMNGEVDGMSVDRRDYSKGIVPKVMGVGNWLHNFGSDGGRIHLLQVAPKGREGVKAYVEESLKIETAVETVNEIFNNIVRLEASKMERGKHLGLARHSSFALVTPLRDGFNLYVTEYNAAQVGRDIPGVAVVSKFAGVAKVMNGSLIQVDPFKTESIAEGIQIARTLSKGQRQDMLGMAMKVQEFFNNDRWQISLNTATENAARPRLGL